MITESEEVTIRIAALEQRIEREHDFIERMKAIQRAGKGVVDYIEYDSLSSNKHSHKKKKSRKKRPRRRFFTWNEFCISPYHVIADAEERIKFLKLKLGDNNE